MVASESVAIEASGFTFESDVQPGEVLVFDVRTAPAHASSGRTQRRMLRVCLSCLFGST